MYFFNKNVALDIVGDTPFFELFKIRKIVLKELFLDDMERELTKQRYYIRAISDEDFFAIIEEKEKENKTYSANNSLIPPYSLKNKPLKGYLLT
jgi:hypothetical protein